MKSRSEFRSNQADYIKKGETSILATLYGSVVKIMDLDSDYQVAEEKIFHVKKSASELHLNYNNTFLTITDSGVVDVYNMEDGKEIAQFKSKMKSRILIYPLKETGEWIYIDIEKVVCFSNDFKEKKTILLLSELFPEGVLYLNSSKHYSDNHNQNNCVFSFFVTFRESIEGKCYTKDAGMIISFEQDKPQIEVVNYESGNKLTYDFFSQSYYGAFDDNMVYVDKNGVSKSGIKLPVIKKYSDGDGVLWVEEFLNYPEKVLFLSEKHAVLIYDFSIIILDITVQKIVAAFSTQLQRFCFVLDSKTICFSSGLNACIVALEDVI